MSLELEKRTIKFGKDIIHLCKEIKFNAVTSKIIDQLVRSGTSIGANYMEAVNASSRRDFQNKIFICKKESQETKYWLNMLLECEPDYSETISNLSKECHEFNLIFQKIVTTLKNNKIDKTDKNDKTGN